HALRIREGPQVDGFLHVVAARRSAARIGLGRRRFIAAGQGNRAAGDEGREQRITSVDAGCILVPLISRHHYLLFAWVLTTVFLGYSIRSPSSSRSRCKTRDLATRTAPALIDNSAATSGADPPSMAVRQNACQVRSANS